MKSFGLFVMHGAGIKTYAERAYFQVHGRIDGDGHLRREPCISSRGICIHTELGLNITVYSIEDIPVRYYFASAWCSVFLFAP